MKDLSRAGSSRKVKVSAWDLIFLWGIMSMGVLLFHLFAENRHVINS